MESNNICKSFFALLCRCFDILLALYLALSGSGWPGCRLTKDISNSIWHISQISLIQSNNFEKVSFCLSVVEQLLFFMFSSIVTFDFGLIWVILTFCQSSNAVSGSTHVVEQLSFSMIPSILTFEFDSILGSFLTFWSPNGLFFVVGQGSKSVLGVYSCS